jgi:Putative lumazine-binding
MSQMTKENQIASSQSDVETIKVTLETYFKGHATGDASYMREAFMETAHIEGFRETTFLAWTLEEYCAIFAGEPAADETNRVRTIDAIDVSGKSAMARATLVHGAMTFTDHFVMLEINGTWKIANKTFYGKPT